MIFGKDKDNDAMMIAQIVKEDKEPKVDPRMEARKMAVRKMMDAMKSDDAEQYMVAMDELRDIDSDDLS
jgi:hypothetical protein